MSQFGQPLPGTMIRTQTLIAQFDTNTYPLTITAENGTVTPRPICLSIPMLSSYDRSDTRPGYHFVG